MFQSLIACSLIWFNPQSNIHVITLVVPKRHQDVNCPIMMFKKRIYYIPKTTFWYRVSNLRNVSLLIQPSMAQGQGDEGLISLLFKIFLILTHYNVFLKHVNTFSLHLEYLDLGNKYHFQNTCPLPIKKDVLKIHFE